MWISNKFIKVLRSFINLVESGVLDGDGFGVGVCGWKVGVGYMICIVGIREVG